MSHGRLTAEDEGDVPPRLLMCVLAHSLLFRRHARLLRFSPTQSDEPAEKSQVPAGGVDSFRLEPFNVKARGVQGGMKEQCRCYPDVSRSLYAPVVANMVRPVHKYPTKSICEMIALKYDTRPRRSNALGFILKVYFPALHVRIDAAVATARAVQQPTPDGGAHQVTSSPSSWPLSMLCVLPNSGLQTETKALFR